MASNPTFGAVQKLSADLIKTQAAADVALSNFHIGVAAEQYRQQTEAAKLQARDEAQRAGQPAKKPIQFGALFKEQPLVANGGQPAPTTVSDAIAASGQAGVAGGGAVQRVLKGGGGAGPGGYAVPDQITRTQTTQGVQATDRGVYGTVFQPVTTRQTTTEPNVLTAAQAAQLQQSAAQFEVQRADEQRRFRSNLVFTLAKEIPGARAAELAGAADALARGDSSAALGFLGGSLEKLNKVEETQRSLEFEKLRATIDEVKSSTDLNRAQTLKIMGERFKAESLATQAGLPVANLSGVQLTNVASGLFNTDGEFKPGEIGNLHLLQGSYLNQGQLFLVNDKGSFSFGSDDTTTVPLGNAVNDIAAIVAGGKDQAQAAYKRLQSVRVNDEPLFVVRGGELAPAVPRDNPNYRLLDGVITLGAKYAELGVSAQVAPPQSATSETPAAPPDPLESAVQKLDQAITAFDEKGRELNRQQSGVSESKRGRLQERIAANNQKRAALKARRAEVLARIQGRKSAADEAAANAPVDVNLEQLNQSLDQLLRSAQ